MIKTVDYNEALYRWLVGNTKMGAVCGVVRFELDGKTVAILDKDFTLKVGYKTARYKNRRGYGVSAFGWSRSEVAHWNDLMRYLRGHKAMLSVNDWLEDKKDYLPNSNTFYEEPEPIDGWGYVPAEDRHDARQLAKDSYASEVLRLLIKDLVNLDLNVWVSEGSVIIESLEDYKERTLS